MAGAELGLGLHPSEHVVVAKSAERQSNELDQEPLDRWEPWVPVPGQYQLEFR